MRQGITIDEGDSVTWTVAGDVHPTVPQGGSAFDGRNFVSSGILAPGQTYTLSFTTGTIVVQPRGPVAARGRGTARSDGFSSGRTRSRTQSSA